MQHSTGDRGDYITVGAPTTGGGLQVLEEVVGDADPIAVEQVIVRHEPSRYERWVKPVIDFAGGLALSLLLTPVMAVIAFLTWSAIGSPVLLRQERVGKGGRRFAMFKFRTMEPDRRVEQVPFEGGDRRLSHKRDDDPRLYPFGRFLRKWSLDELPQLLNVVRGEMSLVGPRPELSFIVENHYRDEHHRRHEVKPGLTGLWQISERDQGLMYEHVMTDLRYLDQVAFGTDLKILAQTPLAALGKKKGY